MQATAAPILPRNIHVAPARTHHPGQRKTWLRARRRDQRALRVMSSACSVAHTSVRPAARIRLTQRAHAHGPTHSVRNGNAITLHSHLR
jgi:hypothetical protein